MKNKFLLVTLLSMTAMLSTSAFAVSGKVKKLVSYSYMKGVQVYFEEGYTLATTCANSGVITILGSDVNSVHLMSMVSIAFATGKTLNCPPKPGCTGINSEEAALYCIVTN
ncbi:MAG: hypothetical protein HRT35_20905 [Algicola sp.]|nr:hypothetical protein [Algicola sp.]